MSQRLLHKCLFLWAVARILIASGCLTPRVGDCGKPAALLGSADVQVGHDLAIYIHDPCAYLCIGRFVRLPSGLCIVVINFDHNSKKAIRHGCDRYGVRIPYIWWRRGESNSRPKTLPWELLRAQTVIAGVSLSLFPSPWASRHAQGSGELHDSWPAQSFAGARAPLNDAQSRFVVLPGWTAAVN